VVVGFMPIRILAKAVEIRPCQVVFNSRLTLSQIVERKGTRGSPSTPRRSRNGGVAARKHADTGFEVPDGGSPANYRWSLSGEIGIPARAVTCGPA
jgi:hypothetical protein